MIVIWKEIVKSGDDWYVVGLDEDGKEGSEELVEVVRDYGEMSVEEMEELNG